MDNFNYSVDALNVISLFHDTDFMIFVEGIDDELYWRTIFDLADIKGYYIESVGGLEEINKKINSVLNENARVIIAKDRDYSEYSNKNVKHPLIVDTYGYSIENSLYCPISLNTIISKLTRKYVDVLDKIEDWYEVFTNTCEKLIHLDIANSKYNKGIGVMSDCCCQYLHNSKSPSLNKQFVDDKYHSIKHEFTEKEISKVVKLVKKDKRGLRYIIRGHFMTHAVINLVKVLAKQISGKDHKITLDNMYVLTVGYCLTCSKTCKDKVETIASVIKAHQILHA